MRDLIIQPTNPGKGRSFGAVCVATVIANGLFPEASGGETVRPVWAMFAGSDPSLRPFMANLRLGRKADFGENRYRREGDSKRYEFLKSVGYQVAWQREDEGTLATIYHPDIFRLDPGMVDPKGCSFVLLVPKVWIAQQELDVEPLIRHVERFRYPLPEGMSLAALVPTAYLFAAYLDRRTRCPLISDGRFYLQILCSALQQKIASFPGDDITYHYRSDDTWGYNPKHIFKAEGLDLVGMEHAISFSATHEALEEFLAREVQFFFDRAGDFTPLSERIDLSYFMRAE